MFKDGRWFWWVVAGCLTVLVADLRDVGPFAEAERGQAVEVLGDSVEREPSATTTTSTTVRSTPTTLSEDEALEQLQGLDRETLEELESIRGVDPADLPPAGTD